MTLDITLSQSAMKEIQRLASQSNQESDLVIKLEALPGGCNDLYYDLSFAAQQDSEDDQVLMSYEYFKLAIPESSYSRLNGLHIDYSEDLMGGGFRFSNPNAVQTCGCGTSFSISAES